MADPATPAPGEVGTTAIVAGTPPPAPPPAPPKPAPPKPPAKGTDRRLFFFRLFSSPILIAWATLTAALLGMTLGTLRFLFPNVLSEPPSVFKAGDLGAYEENKVEDKYKDQGAWVIKSRDEQGRMILYALSTICTHLGCTPNWLEGEKKFKCPCHGSGFKISGVNFEGPAPRPLERFAIRRTEENQIIVDKSRKFQKELGQWSDADSYIPV